VSLWLALVTALGIIFFLAKSRRNYLALPALPLDSLGPAQSDVTVIIPARNEEMVIERAVHSFKGFRVVVVDDASQDRTAELAQRAGAEVFRAPPLEPCILGKPNACRAGAAAATSAWLLFVDADTWYKPQLVPSLVNYATREALDVVTLFLRQEMYTPVERVLLPYAFALYFCGVSAARVNSPHSKEALANGQCLLFRRGAYEAIGGHGVVARSVIEDVALASLAKSRGLRLRVMRAEHLGFVRMYDSFVAIRKGFEKNSFRFLNVNPLTGLQVIAASILLTSYLPVLILLFKQQYWIPAILFALIPSLFLAPWYSKASYALTAPIAIYGFQMIALSAMVRTITGIKTTWKGRGV
jgi:chlorobactene glucosyltransferase